MSVDRAPHIPASEITPREIYLSRRHFIGTAVAVLNASGPASTAVASSTQAAAYAPMVGAAVYDFNVDSGPSTPGYDWND